MGVIWRGKWHEIGGGKDVTINKLFVTSKKEEDPSFLPPIGRTSGLIQAEIEYNYRV
jgi:hypothetical protein